MPRKPVALASRVAPEQPPVPAGAGASALSIWSRRTYREGVYETFEHTADIGLRVRAKDLPKLFGEAATGLFSLITEDPPPPVGDGRHSFSISGSDVTLLFFDWLAELLYVFATAHVGFFDFDVRFSSHGLDADATSYPINPARVDRELKAITYHRLAVEQREDGWVAEFIVDV